MARSAAERRRGIGLDMPLSMQIRTIQMWRGHAGVTNTTPAKGAHACQSVLTRVSHHEDVMGGILALGRGTNDEDMT